MKTEFIMALTQLAAEKNLSKETVLQDLEAALATAYKKDENIVPHQFLWVKVDPTKGNIRVMVEKAVVDEVTDPRREISLEEARQHKAEVEVGQNLEVEITPQNAGRIAVQIAKQVLIQRLRKTEQASVFEEYQTREGEIISGVVHKVEPRQAFVDLGRTLALLPLAEQIPGEKLREGKRLRVYVLEVNSTPRGTQVVVSRTHKNLLRRLFELEIPEVSSGRVEVKGMAREPGSRSKVAVAGREEGLDPVGACVGLRGIRIQNIVKELNGEKIDIIQWQEDPAQYIANALSPAQVIQVHTEDGVATVVVPDKQFSLAIGKEGQNARLAARLTGWRIDIKSASVAGIEIAPPPEVIAVSMAEQVLAEATPSEVADVMAEEAVPATIFERDEVVPKPVEEVVFSIPTAESTASLRFAEDIFASRGGKKVKTAEEEKVKPKRVRRASRRPTEEEEETPA